MTQPTLTIHAVSRTLLKRRSGRLRREGNIPAVVYGRETAARPITVAASEFARAYRDAGESTLLNLEVDGGSPMRALIQDIAHDVVSGQPIHVDFRAVSMTEEIHAHIPLQFVGIAPIAKDVGGVIVKQFDHVEVKALASALVHAITVDISPLTTLESVIRIRDLVVPEGIKIQHAPDEIVVSVTEATEEEVVSAPAASAASVEVVGAKGKEATTATEGAEPKAEEKGKKEKK